VGLSSPSTTAVVIIRSAIPEPLPKCLAPDTRWGLPSRNGSRSGSGTATAFVLAMSPPLPGSEVMVPHWRPSAAAAKTAERWACQTGSVGSGEASQ